MKVAIIGYGKMGKEIEKILIDRGHEVVLKIDINNTDEMTVENLKKADVAIEFTSPHTAFENIRKCLEAGVKVISGSTGWLERFKEITDYCKSVDGTFFYASNYSIGVNVTFKVNELLAKLMNDFPEYDVTIEETHHTQKKDAPSGTAITFAEGIIENMKRKNKWICGVTTEPEELEITSVRRSVAPGTHVMTYESPVDTITLTHYAKNRHGLAVGAVIAAEYAYKNKGILNMSNLLGF